MASAALTLARKAIESADIEIIDCLKQYEPKVVFLSQNAAKFLTDRVAESLEDCPQEVMIAVLERINLTAKNVEREEDNLVALAKALASRFDAAVHVARAKKEEGRETSYDETQHNNRLETNRKLAWDNGMNTAMVSDVFEHAIMANFVKYQDEYLARETGPIRTGVLHLTSS